MTAADMFALADAGLLPEKLELVEGRPLAAGHSEYVFPAAEARAAARLGIRVRTCVDAALEDPETREELCRRLR
jgi:hypothetical protein